MKVSGEGVFWFLALFVCATFPLWVRVYCMLVMLIAQSAK